MQREMFYDKKFAASLEAAGEAPAEGGEGGGLGDLGGDLGGDDDAKDDAGGGLDLDLGGGDDKPADDAGGDTPAGDTGGGDEGDTTLLAEPPAKRDDKRGPYNRRQRNYHKGGRTKKLKNIASVSKDAIRATPRTMTPGWLGDHGMNPLANMSKSYTVPSPLGTLQEQKSVDNDLLEEQKLFTVNNEVEKLLKSLNKMEIKQYEDET